MSSAALTLLSSIFLDAAKVHTLTQSDLRAIATHALETSVMSLEKKTKKQNNKMQVYLSQAIASALDKSEFKQKCLIEQAIDHLKMDYAEAIVSLLESTKGSMQNAVSRWMLDSVTCIDNSLHCAVNDMLGSSLERCSKVGAELQEELLDVKQINFWVNSSFFCR